MKRIKLYLSLCLFALVISFFSCRKENFDLSKTFNSRKIENFWEYEKRAPILNMAVQDLRANNNAASFEAYISELGRPLWNASMEFTDSTGVSTLMVPVVDEREELTTAVVTVSYTGVNYVYNTVAKGFNYPKAGKEFRETADNLFAAWDNALYNKNTLPNKTVTFLGVDSIRKSSKLPTVKEMRYEVLYMRPDHRVCVFNPDNGQSSCNWRYVAVWGYRYYPDNTGTGSTNTNGTSSSPNGNPSGSGTTYGEVAKETEPTSESPTYDATIYDNLPFYMQIQAQSLPAYTTFEQNFPNKSAPEVYKQVGGQIYRLHLDNPMAYSNACALRISVALNESGKPIPALPGTEKGADGKNYFYQVQKLYAYMKKAFPSPSVDLGEYPTETQLKNTINTMPRGIYIMLAAKPGFNYFQAQGHATVFNGTSCLDNCYLAPKGGVYKFTLWELK